MADLSMFKGAIFDEAHFLKEGASKRTQAAHKVVAAVPEQGLAMFLTGTPVLNRPRELVELLLMMGVLSNEPGSRKTSRWFLNRYCYDKASGGYGGATNEGELAKFLRSVGMVRRTKDQVLTELPAKVRVPQWVQLSPVAKRRFDALAADIVRKYRQTGKWYIQDITALRKAAAEAKAIDGLAWAREFLSTTDKQLVIFAHHQVAQNMLIDGLTKDGYLVTHVLGSQKDVEEHKARFMAGTSRVIVCSIRAAGVGHTLTAAQDVLLVEQSWTPADHWQAEDRLHRIGQTGSVTAWYLLAEDIVIDDYMFDLVAGKASVVHKITDDADAMADERSIVAGLMDKLAERYDTGAQAA